MALLKRDVPPRDAKSPDAHSSTLARVMREFNELVKTFETGLLQSLDAPLDQNDGLPTAQRERARREACRLAISDLSSKYTRKYIRQSLNAAESEGKRVEERLHNLSLGPPSDGHHLRGLHNGYFRLYSTELFDLMGQPTDLRFGTLRFHKHIAASPDHEGLAVELALNNAFFVADSTETLPYHTFRLPAAPSLQNRGILSRKPEDGGAFPPFDSWLLFTFLGNGCIKLEVPIEMCADVYGGNLQGRENEEVLFWGFFIDDEIDS